MKLQKIKVSVMVTIYAVLALPRLALDYVGYSTDTFASIVLNLFRILLQASITVKKFLFSSI